MRGGGGGGRHNGDLGEDDESDDEDNPYDGDIALTDYEERKADWLSPGLRFGFCIAPKEQVFSLLFVSERM